jgi:ribose transport system substrate-binding protein/putative xylitol transport system substrate-binding protein
VVNGQAKLTVFDANYDQLTQDRQFDEMIVQKFDAILLDAVDSNASTALIHRAVAAGIPVVGSNAPLQSQEIVSYIGSDDTAAGRKEGEVLAQALGGKGNIVGFQGPIGQLSSLQRWDGAKESLAKNPGIKVLEVKTANWSRAEAMTLMQNWLTAHPGQINGVIGGNDEMALGAIAAMRSQGVDPKKVPSVGIDGVYDALMAVKKGDMILSIAQNAHAQSQGALDIALRKLIGEGYQPLSDIWKDGTLTWNDGQDKFYPVPWKFVTKENVDAVLATRQK